MNQERLLQRFLRYITCDSQSREEREFCLMIEDELGALGVVPERQEIGVLFGSNGWNIHALLPGQGTPMLFCAHLDTMAPGRGISPSIEDGVIRTDGTTVLGADDKAGVAAAMEALTSLIESGVRNRPVEFLFTICEEVGLLGSKHADYAKILSRQAVVLDNEQPGHIVNRQAAQITLHAEIRGRSAHAGTESEKGSNALKAAAQAVAAIECGKVGRESVRNIANFAAPGRTNAVPDLASFNAEIRSHSEEELAQLAAELEEKIRAACAHYGTTYTLTQERVSNLLYVPEDSELVREVSGALWHTGVEPVLQQTFGGCDATWFAENAIAAVNIGVGIKDAHSCRESIGVNDLFSVTHTLEQLMRAPEETESP